LYRQLRKRTKKKKARRKILSGPRFRHGFSGPALRFSLLAGLSELGLFPALKHADKLFPPSTAMLTDSI